MTVKVGCIVEGHGDVVAVPLLIRRIAAELHPDLVIETPRPIRVQRNQVVQMDKFERRVELAAQRIGGQGAIFIILDADNACPAQLGPELLNRASQVCSDLPIAVVLAKYEFEAWFLASAESLRGQRGLRDNIQPPNDPETIREAKEWLTHRMQGNRTYSETHDQPALTACFNIEHARQANSFDKCYREISRLLDELQKASDSASKQM